MGKGDHSSKNNKSANSVYCLSQTRLHIAQETAMGKGDHSSKNNTRHRHNPNIRTGLLYQELLL